VKVAIPFFIIVTFFSLLWNNGSEIFAGDFATVSEVNFTNGKWVRFWSIKVIMSFIYGVYTTNKKMK
jgi:hypothetical protein